MHPVLYTFDFGDGQLVVRAYATCLAAAVLAVLLLGGLAAVRRGLPVRAVVTVLGLTAVAGLLGARLFHAVLHADVYRQSPERLIAPQPHSFAFDGGLIVAIAAGWLSCRLLRISPWRLADALTPALALGMAVMRLGCFLQGCCFGRETSLPWGVVFRWSSLPHLHQMTHRFDAILGGPSAVHPTQLYEMAAALSVAVLAVWLPRLRAPEGMVILPCALAFLIFRGVASAQRAVAGSPSSTIALSVLIALLMIFRFRSRRGFSEDKQSRAAVDSVVAHVGAVAECIR